MLAECQTDRSKEINKKVEHPSSRYLDEYFSAHTELNDFNGCVLVRKGDTLLLRKAYNMYLDTAHSMRVNSYSQFDIHSVSKLMAQAIIIDLEAAGKMNRSDLLSEYLPDFPNGDRITVQHLLDNASGIPRELQNIEAPEEGWNADSLIKAIAQQELEFDPGTDKRYSNLGYQLVYYIVAQVTGKPFGLYVSDEVFYPLGMDDSGAHPYTDEKNLREYAINHEADDDTVEAVTHYFNDSKPMARLYSTIDDLDKYLDILEREPYRSELASDKGIIAWAGGSDGIRAYIHSNVPEGYHYVLLANYDGIAMQNIINDIEHIMAGEEYEIPKALNRIAVPVDVQTLEKYIGIYDFMEADHLELEFVIERDSLAVYQEGERLATLFAENDSVFFSDPTDQESFTFLPSQGGEKMLMDWLGISFEGYRK